MYDQQLATEREKYAALLQKEMVDRAEHGAAGAPYEQLRSFEDPARLHSSTEIVENQQTSRLTLIHRRDSKDGSLEEFIVCVQGYLVEAKLPPVRHTDVPRTNNLLISLSQSVVISGLGLAEFEDAFKGLMIIYQGFQNRTNALKGNLREWRPMEHDGHIALKFSNRYFTKDKHAGDDRTSDLADVIDPFNIIRPLIRGEFHTSDNVVEYWERKRKEGDTGHEFSKIQPQHINVSNLVELQIAFTTARLGRQEHVFLPKLRSVCVLDRTVERDRNDAAIRTLINKPRSPLKKIKRKVGYGQEVEEQDVGATSDIDLKRLRIDGDVRMKERV